ncbi:MAG: FixH family protein [Bdellovibrionales bacterium]|nr:FixH family protein [Ramlibacter sp.]
MQHDNNGRDTRPWWRYGYLWLVLSGPAVVVVAALATGYIALRNQDPVVDANYYRHGLDINKTLAGERALLPGVEGRNHAVTPVRPPEVKKTP